MMLGSCVTVYPKAAVAHERKVWDGGINSETKQHSVVVLVSLCPNNKRSQKVALHYLCQRSAETPRKGFNKKNKLH